MNAFQQKASAQRRFTELTKKLGFRPDVNLRTLNAKQIESINHNLVANNPLTYFKKVITLNQFKTPKIRSKMIQQIKEINPSFKSSKSDTYDQLSLKYRKQLKKKPFLLQIRNKNLIEFLKTPIDEKSFVTDADSFLNQIHHMNLTNDYYLVMAYDESSDNVTKEQFKVISNIQEIKEMAKLIKQGNDFEETGSTGYGSDTEVLLKLIEFGKSIKLTWYSIESYSRVHSGAFFKYFNMTTLDLSRYQIYGPKQENSDILDSVNCLIYALQMSDKVSKKDIENLQLSLFHREIKARDLKAIASKLKITITLRYDPKQSTSVFNKGCATEVSLGLVDNHYFINEPTMITKYALEHYEEVKSNINFPLVHPKKCKQVPLSSYQVINMIFSKYKDSMLESISLDNVINKQCVDKLADYSELRAPTINCSCILQDDTYLCDHSTYDTKCSRYFCRLQELLDSCECSSKTIGHEFKDYGVQTSKKPFRGFFKNKETDPNANYDLWFVDSETFIKQNLNYHIANTLCAIKYDKKKGTFISYDFFGLDCVERFLKQLERNAIIYAHNMAFDFRVFIDHLYDLQTPIEVGTKLKQIQGKFQTGFYTDKKGKQQKSFVHLLFKDSYAFLPVKLSALPAMLSLPCGDKEVFPYTLINEHNFDKCIPLSECRKHVKKGLRKAFTINARKIGAMGDDLMVDMKLYTLHYCKQDTLILAQAFIKFRAQILEVCKIDIIPLVSLPQLSDDFLKSKGVYTDCYAISGIAQDFIRRCCIGGRVMTNSNQKWHIKVDKQSTTVKSNVGRGSGCFLESTTKELDALYSGFIMDFDAVSLYPSAMSMMKGYVKGLPKVLSKEQINNFDTLKDSFDTYYVEIEVTNHIQDREFPLLSIKSKSGIRNFTNQIDGERFYIDNIALEDLIEFQGVKYKVIRGYYYDDGYNTKIIDVIAFMFNERLRLKKEGNNLQNVYKLLMNASYGKLIQKAIKTSKKFIETDQLRKYVAKNHKFVDSYTKVNDNLYAIKENKSTITHFTACHIASNILSMSKRLMNRVMCLAEDIGIKIYYQDTDSMHLHGSTIPLLSDAFQAKYKTELIGKAMCQFHTDFEVSEKGASNIRAVESIFLGKKCYIDKLKYTNHSGNDKYDYHIRMKGVPSQSIRDFDKNHLNTYLRLLEGEELEFDLSAYCPLQIDADYRARANTKCIARKLKFT